MWGNLDKLASPGWKGTLQKIGNAVAPRPDDEVYDEDEDDDYEEEEYDEQEEEEEEEEEEDSGPRGFGFVGMLARALDQTTTQGEQEEGSSVDGEGPDDHEAGDSEEYDFSNAEKPAFETSTNNNTALFDTENTNNTMTAAENEVPVEASGIPMDDLADEPAMVEPVAETYAAGNSGSSPSQVEPEVEKFVQETTIETMRMEPNHTLVVPSDVPESQPPEEKNHPATEVNITPPTETDKSSSEPASVEEEKKCVDANIPMPLQDSNHQPVQVTKTVQPTIHAPVEERILEESQRIQNEVVTKSVDRVTSEALDREIPANDTDEDPIQIPMSKSRKASKTMSKSSDEAEDNAQIQLLQSKLEEERAKFNALREKMMTEFQEKEMRLLEASAEEHQHELLQAENRHQEALQSLEMRITTERSEFVKAQQQLQQKIEMSTLRAERAEAELRIALKKHESQLTHANQQEKRSTRMAEEKVAQSLALLDERNEEIARLKKALKEMESSMNEHAEGVEEAEQEVEELQTENEGLQEHVEALEAECAGLKEKLSKLEGETEKLGALQMELTMLREERDRERAKNQSVVESTMTSHSQIEAERDSAVAEVRNLKQQLAAALADMEVLKMDNERILTANTNLQNALEAFQDERQAEIALGDEQRREAEEVLRNAHAAAMEIAEHRHREEINKLQFAADQSIQLVREEIQEVKDRMQQVKTENGQMRRSLDEAIHRLQTTQEDVIDRTIMKSILLDWCTMKDKAKRQQVLQVMASLLHFTDAEKESVHLTHMDIDTVRSKVVGALAAPLPPSKADVEHLQGANVSEKWVNFLLAETDDGA